jgi:xanthine dehydrogenase YagR molybdenum-binding subunit
MAEPAVIPTASAIANAVYNASGARVRSLPMTPAKVLEALGKVRSPVPVRGAIGGVAG